MLAKQTLIKRLKGEVKTASEPKLLQVFYNGHLTNNFYDFEVEEKIALYGLPLEDLDVVYYPEGTTAKFPYIIPQNDNPNLTMSYLEEYVPPDAETPVPVLFEFKKWLKESKEGRFLQKAFTDFNKKLKENNFPPVQLDISKLEEDSGNVTVYQITGMQNPIEYMKKGKMVRNFQTGKKI